MKDTITLAVIAVLAINLASVLLFLGTFAMLSAYQMLVQRWKRRQVIPPPTTVDYRLKQAMANWRALR